ncbi:hypothetical protein E0W68_08685 [Flavobacterium salilacus subsp. salilacus]|uniref:hypothetical protein n=1 Tax=Flavobacterium TaxID=237 RepID=UPI001074F639|nr:MULTISPECIES: hypothetical protein [Flavobacterium]KAF2518397.1 hypothetical protein E0W68_08685 [Flavobacterium salilacus subsp. salilacus]MBE1615031.1 hypothetical protein [Flavobacterium sp. SaA2.13]
MSKVVNDNPMTKEDQKKEIEIIINKQKKFYNYIAALSLIAIVIGLTALIIQNKSQNEELKNIESISTENSINDSVIDSKKDYVIQFLDLNNSKQNIKSCFSNDVDRFYLKTNLNSNQIEKETNDYYNKFPRARVFIDKTSFVIKLNEDKSSEIFVNGKYYTDSLKLSTDMPKDVIFQIKLDDENKIYYVRNLEPVSVNP